MSAVLERRPLPELDPQDLMTESVLNYAHETLGYHHPKKEHLCKEGSLAKSLRVSGIIPFSHDSVRDYKKAQVKKFQGSKDVALPLIKAVVIFLALAMGAVLIRYSVDGAVIRQITEVFGIVSVVLFVASFISFAIWGITERQASWNLVPLKDYQSPVPGFALATAKEIHQRVPKATFSIDELLVKNVQRDPFLVVEGDGETYYVEVWEEPGYEQKRKA